jgi:hypothetical protein
MQITWVEAVASGPNDGNNLREWRAVSVRERAQLVAELQLAPSTHMKLDS